jgi:hypothetical protein
MSADRSSGSLTETNSMVAPIHLKAMPVILTTDEERDIASLTFGLCSSVHALAWCIGRSGQQVWPS